MRPNFLLAFFVFLNLLYLLSMQPRGNVHNQKLPLQAVNRASIEKVFIERRTICCNDEALIQNHDWSK